MYKLLETNERITSQEHKRKLGTETKVKKAKVPKLIKNEAALAALEDEGQGEGVEDGGGEVVKAGNCKPLTDNQKKRLEKAIQEVESKQLKVVLAITVADAPDMKQHVIPSVLQKAKELNATFESDTLPTARRFLAHNWIVAAVFKEFFEKLKAELKSAKELAERLNDMVEDTKEEE